MLKWVLIFALVAIVCGVLGFVLHVAAAIAKVLFFIFLVGFLISLFFHWKGSKTAS